MVLQLPAIIITFADHGRHSHSNTHGYRRITSSSGTPQLTDLLHRDLVGEDFAAAGIYDGVIRHGVICGNEVFPGAPPLCTKTTAQF